MPESKQASPISWIVLVVGGLLLWNQFSGNSPAPKPDDVTPDPAPVVDKSEQAFRDYERLWRIAQGELARKLRSGDIRTETQATEWFSRANNEALKTAFKPLADAEYERFGGEKWTAESHAKQAEEYASGK